MDERIEKHLPREDEKNSMSRRKFIAATSLVLAGTALHLKGLSAPNHEAEPIIDIHQHTGYNGRNDNFLLSHQRAMGVTATILLPAGRPVNSVSTHNGFSNGLQAKVSGNKVTYRYATKHSKEFLFGANEVPDLPVAVKEIEKYLKKGAVVIGELKMKFLF